MFTCGTQHAPQIDDSHPIQCELHDRRTSGRRHADQYRKVFIPGEMLAPAVLTRIIERRQLAGGWVNRLGGKEFSVIAALARQSQVRRIGGPSAGSRRDVLDLKRIGGEPRQRAAVFTASARALRHNPLVLLTDAAFRHRVEP